MDRPIFLSANQPDDPKAELLATIELIAAHERTSGHLLRRGYEYAGMHDFVLREGTWFDAPTEPHDYRQGAPKKCYANAIHAAIYYGLRYVEGIGCTAVAPDLPVHHAWNVQPPLRVALVRAPAEQILGHVAVGAEDLEVIAFRLSEEAPVELVCVVPGDPEGEAVGGSVLLDVVDRQKLERALAAARAPTAVQLHDGDASLASLLAHAPTVDLAHPLGIPLSAEALGVSRILAAPAASLESLGGGFSLAAGAELRHAGDFTSHSGRVLTTHPGTVIDVTWGAYSEGVCIVPIGIAYCGVEFSPERADDATWNGDATTLDDYNRGWPLLKEKWNGEPADLEWPHSIRLEAVRAYRDGDADRAEALYDQMEAEAGL